VRNIASRNQERNILIIRTVNNLYPLIALSHPYTCSVNYGLFNDALTSSDYTVSNCGNNEKFI
jgi:hypothetical protein